MRQDDDQWLQDMLTYAREAVALARSRNRAALDADRLFELALTRLIEIVGEAACRITVTRQALLPHIPWKNIIGMRNRLAHGYDVVDNDLLWTTVSTDLPNLISALESSQ